MPSVIGTDAGSGVDIAANYRKQIVPFSRFGTRKIVWFRVGHLDTNEGGLNMDAFNAVIDAIQTKGEIVTVGAPYVNNNYGKFMIGLFEDTFNNGNNTDPEEFYTDNNMTETLEQAIQNVLDAGNYDQPDDVQVTQMYMFGAPWNNPQDNNAGWSDDSNYAEPDYKRDFNNGPYGV